MVHKGLISNKKNVQHIFHKYTPLSESESKFSFKLSESSSLSTKLSSGGKGDSKPETSDFKKQTFQK